MSVKSLFHKPHLSPAYWGMAYQHAADIQNITSGRDGLSPYALWHGHPFDLTAHPVLPFGSVIAAHKPLATQTALSGRSIEAVYVGIAHSYVEFLILFNPITKRSFVRHSFKFISEDEPVTTS